MTSHDRILLSEGYLWGTTVDSLVNGTCSGKRGIAQPEYVWPQYKRRAYIRQTNTEPDNALGSDPRSVAGHVRKREGQEFAALASTGLRIQCPIWRFLKGVVGGLKSKVMTQMEGMEKMKTTKEAKMVTTVTERA